MDGYPVVLPCSFSHPRHSQHSSLQVLWRLGHGPDAVILYQCTSTPAAPTCEPGPKQEQRYRLEGNPKEHDLSLRINSATLQDNGRYYCRVEVQGQKHIGLEDKMGTRLRVEGKSTQTRLTLSWTGTVGGKTDKKCNILSIYRYTYTYKMFLLDCFRIYTGCLC